MRVLVTGSRGFVGKRLARALEQKGHAVKEFDLALGNDLLDPAQCMQACNGIDAVFHLAAVLDEKSPLLEKVNILGTENMLDAAAKQKCEQFIFLSTAGVNAGCKGIIDEKSPFMPKTPYEKSKAKAERLAIDSQEMLPITIIRSALVLGPNEYWKGIVKLVKKGFPLIGGGKQEWQTIYIDDLVSALLFVLGKKECLGETFIVSEQGRPTLRKIYAEIQKQLGIKAKIKTMPAWAAKLFALLRGNKGLASIEHINRLTRKRSYSTAKISALGWKAKTGTEEAVEKTARELSLL
jgi:nucleoside-diphosphate-sugar epimerase